MIAEQIKTTVAGIALAIAMIVTGFAVWSITSNSYKSDIAKIEKNHADQIAQYERNIGAIKSKAQEDTKKAIERMKDAQNALAELDYEKTKELANAKAENDALMRDVADGTRRVRILQANLSGCSGSNSATGGDPSTGSMGDGTAIELTTVAANTVLSIREGIISDQAKLTYLQSYVKDVVKQCKRM